ncbi:Glutamate receptor ionotropic, kainate 2 [Orchesella cincta]|uniref:Glutamate receptor ionotropic, kainate 2 n=1 Tax=Orchesella cincta TaxID=48709 RepID=A0A1D2MRL9_ORCCI|nr:Glutamate receptor ionotropic, kainate 2 [Orchesella cincta]
MSKLLFVYVGELLIYLLTCIPFTATKFLLLVDENSEDWSKGFQDGLADFQDSFGTSYDYKAVVYKNESHWQEVCQFIANGVTVILDLTKRIGDPETRPQKFFTSKSMPYFKVDTPYDALLRTIDSLVQVNNGSNGFLIFNSDLGINRGVNTILGTTIIRFAFLQYPEQEEMIVEKFQYRVPSAVSVIGTESQIREFTIKQNQLVRNRTEWILILDEFVDSTPPTFDSVRFPYFRGYLPLSVCCSMLNTESEAGGSSSRGCSIASCKESPTNLFLRRLAYIMSQVLLDLDPKGEKVTKLGCTDQDSRAGDKDFTNKFSDSLNQKSEGLYETKNGRLSFNAPVQVEDFVNGSGKAVGTYTFSKGITLNPAFVFRTRKRYFRIGIVESSPWTMRSKDNNQWIGYCIDLAAGIAGKMDFEYDLVLSADFGRRMPPHGRWSGLTGDLIHGKIDIAVAPYIMTSEREEFIDFVSPYYEQSGLIITMKRPVAKNSLFKFMTVLRTEVWLSILGATIATAILLWFLDKYSPYSAQNNPNKYKSFRKFTLKESFWFALTSFTPQGGGEPPKALSGRTLVAAYWIFVVLMLATFTANLAAFLTVERMQSPIKNLDHLASQSSVKYSVVNSSTAMTFFRNMAHAEEILYQMWRNLTLKAPSSAREYVVWEYPIREMYIHINSVIQKTKAVDSMDDGFQRAIDDDYYAFIHDAAQTKYEVYQNCNLTLIGEAFAEAPYGLAVAQGNPLQDDLSMAILQLQTERFFETLSSKYWTNECTNLGDGESDGISLESLGGVFIATIIGLGIAFVSLAIEVFTTARNRRKAKIAEESMIKPKFVGPLDFYGNSNKAITLVGQAGGNTQKSEVLRRANFLPEVMN